MSLWLHRQFKPIRIDLARFKGDEAFAEAFVGFDDLSIPRFMMVRWDAFKDFLVAKPSGREAAVVEELAARIQAGEDVPPLVRDAQAVFDGRLRAWAAKSAGIRWAPAIDISTCWQGVGR